LISCLEKDWDIFEYLLDNSNIYHFEELIVVLCSYYKIDLLKKIVQKQIIMLKEINPHADERLTIESQYLCDAFRTTINNAEIYNFLFENFHIDYESRKVIISALGQTNNYDGLDQFLTKYGGFIHYPYLEDFCEYNSEEMITCLIKHYGAYIHPLNTSNPTLLTKIAGRNFIRIAQMLLDKKIDINHQSDRGWTALMAAVTNGHIEMVKFLMENGADKTLKNDKGRDVLEMAKYRDRKEIIKILIKN
jgi:ankyrin repeat protein